MLGEFAFYGLVIVLGAPIFAVWWYRRSRPSGALIIREDYQRTPEGHLRTDHAFFDITARQITLNEPGGGQRRIAFDAVRGLSIMVLTSRKIHLGLLLDGVPDDEPLMLSIVTNHDLRRAGINAHHLAETLAGQGEAFLVAFRAHEWPRALIGATFRYTFR